MTINFSGITHAFAETTTQTTQPATTTNPTTPATTSTQGSFLHMLPMLIIFVVVFYFLLVRPQTKRAKEQREMLSKISLGDEVMTSAGIVGRISKLKDNYVVLTVGKENEIIIQKGAIASVLPKGTISSLEN